jgi:hypothetical protein
MIEASNFEFHSESVLLAFLQKRQAGINQRLNAINFILTGQIPTLETTSCAMDDLAIRCCIRRAVFLHFGIDRFEAPEAVQKRSMPIQRDQPQKGAHRNHDPDTNSLAIIEALELRPTSKPAAIGRRTVCNGYHRFC